MVRLQNVEIIASNHIAGLTATAVDVSVVYTRAGLVAQRLNRSLADIFRG